ncbi:MAG: tetratricopeptide repeat protein [Planctomycetota bacterium]
MARIPSAVLAAALLLLPLRSEGSEFWDAHYRAGDNARSLELHRRLLIEGPHDGIAGLDEDASRAVWEEAHLRFILELTREQRSYGEARATLEGFLEKEHPPLLDALARQNLASYRWLLHDLAGARSTWRELAFLTDWWIIGSFENERGSGLSRRYPPEEGFDPDAVYRGKRHDVTWRRWSDPGRAGLVELGSLLRPPEEAVAYLLTHLHAPEPTEAVLRIGSSGSYALWLNGREAARRDVERRLHFDQDAVVVRLEEGWNRLLVKSGQTKGSWRFRARLSRRDGAPLAGIRILAALPEGASLAEAGGPLPPQDAPLGAVTLLAEAEPSAESLHLLGWLLRARGAHDVTEHPDRGAHLRALELEPGSAVGEHLLARTYRREITHSAEREENPWRQALERALDLDPSFHRLRVELARYHLQRFANLTRAEEILRPALASEEPPSAALDLQAKILEARHGEAAAARLSRRLAERLEGELLLPVRLREIDRAREEGRIEEAQSLVDAGLTHSPTSPSLLRPAPRGRG